MAAAPGNKYAVGNNGGRPPLFATPDELMNSCDGYFEYVKGEFHLEAVQVKNPETEQI